MVIGNLILSGLCQKKTTLVRRSRTADLGITVFTPLQSPDLPTELQLSYSDLDDQITEETYVYHHGNATLAT